MLTIIKIKNQYLIYLLSMDTLGFLKKQVIKMIGTN